MFWPQAVIQNISENRTYSSFKQENKVQDSLLVVQSPRLGMTQHQKSRKKEWVSSFKDYST